MKKYTFSFNGRQSGAIGITYQIRDTYKANSIGEAMYLLYTDYDLISGLQAKEGSHSIETANVKLIPCDTSKCYPHRETDPKTGSYRYTRSDTVNQ